MEMQRKENDPKPNECLSSDDWNSKDYEGTLNMRAELDRLESGVRFDPTADTPRAAIQLEKWAHVPLRPCI